jgi:hypothetical protein
MSNFDVTHLRHPIDAQASDGTTLHVELQVGLQVGDVVVAQQRSVGVTRRQRLNDTGSHGGTDGTDDVRE